MLVVRPEGGLFYANADSVRHEILDMVAPEHRAVVLDAQSVPAVDRTAAEMLTSLHEELDRREVRLLIARDVGEVRNVLDHSDAADLGPYLYPTVRDAIASCDGLADES